ncbi:uncharacterized protein PpBr36_05863, partial [Pyricularia pennisetigena]|uniref:uncharacterized protein n=1 Tax=Pyricularia pennisetigena TaxID=1578925 RepID=UPI00114F9398
KFPLWMATWNFFNGEKAGGASTTQCNAGLSAASPLDAVKVVRSSVTTQDNDKKVRDGGLGPGMCSAT